MRRAKINKGLAVGTFAAGAGFMLGNTSYYLIKNAYWNDQAGHWKMQYDSELISKAEYDNRLRIIRNGREELREDVRRNFLISGGFLVASIGFWANAERHKKMITEETSFIITPNGLGLVYRF